MRKLVMESLGAISIILICGLFADNMVMKAKLKDLTSRVKDLEKASAGSETVTIPLCYCN